MPREGRNRRRGCCNAEALLESGCGCGCGGGESFEEDMPMCRHTNPIFTCECCCDCGCGSEDEEALAAIYAVLQEQNRLLSELVCAVTGLTGVALHCCRDRQSGNDY